MAREKTFQNNKLASQRSHRGRGGGVFLAVARQRAVRQRVGTCVFAEKIRVWFVYKKILTRTYNALRRGTVDKNFCH
jgi:hypothetical protein